MKLIEKIKTWFINRKRRRFIKLIVGGHTNNKVSESRAKEMREAIYRSIKIVANAEMLKQHQFDEGLLTSLQEIIEKHYAEKEKEYAEKDKLVNNLQKTVREKTDLLNMSHKRKLN